MLSGVITQKDRAVPSRSGVVAIRRVVTLALLMVAVIHLLPLSGVLGQARLEALYGVAIDDPNLLVLMRHRAVLFGLLGGYLLVAAFVPAMQGPALAMGAISVASFLFLAWTTPGTNPGIARIVTADLVAAAGLVVGSAAWAMARRSR